MELLAWVEYLDSLIPVPTPQEADWLRTELAAGGNRLVEAILDIAQGQIRNLFQFAFFTGASNVRTDRHRVV